MGLTSIFHRINEEDQGVLICESVRLVLRDIASCAVKIAISVCGLHTACVLIAVMTIAWSMIHALPGL